MENREFEDDHVIVSIPYYQCKPFIRKAVESILAQTHRSLSLIVINDGDPDPPWDCLSDIDDPRLIRFNLTSNYGKFFADAVLLNATTAPYFLVQDADDWSEPNRVEDLLKALQNENADMVSSARYNYRFVNDQIIPQGIESSFHLKPLSTRLLSHRVYYHGLYKTVSLKEIGGWYAGYRICYNTFVVNLLFMAGKISYIDRPLYHYLVRPDSLYHCAETGIRSAERGIVMKKLQNMYERAFAFHSLYMAGTFDKYIFCHLLRLLVKEQMTEEEAFHLTQAANRLKEILSGRRT